MKRLGIGFLPTLLLMVVGNVRADAPGPASATPALSQGMRVVVVGPISQRFDPTTRTFVVTIRQAPYTFRTTADSQLIGMDGQPIAAEVLCPGQWVHVDGTVAAAPATIHIIRLQLLGTADQARQSAVYMPRHPDGYVMPVAMAPVAEEV